MDSPSGPSTATVAVGLPASGLAGSPWELDPRTVRVGFEVPYWWGLGTVKGRFTRWWGRIDLGAEPAVLLAIEADSVDTANPRRDRRLRSAQFFSADEHPLVTFVSELVDATTMRSSPRCL
jgi:polyisoprenoid-binding protein YceI